VVAGSFLFGWALWFFKNVANGFVTWAIVINLGVAILAYAEYLPLVNRMVARRPADADQELTRMQMRLRSPAFLLVAALFAFFGVLFYGLYVYDQVPPVFGGGLPIVVRFFGSDVSQLEQIGIGLEPGNTDVSERVELIAQTEDRYIVLVAGRAASFDKSFVRGIRYEPPEFFLDPEFFLASHTRQGARFLEDERFGEALSEFNLVLDRRATYAPALRGRAQVLLQADYLNLDQALADYRALAQQEPQDGDHSYRVATVLVLRAQTQGQPIEIEDVVGALQQAKTISATLGERARSDATFIPLRGDDRFDKPIYGSGPAAARWFRDLGAQAAVAGALDVAFDAYQWAVFYAERYRDEGDALSATEIADLYVALGLLYDPFSDEALDEFLRAVNATGGEDPYYLNLLAALYRERNQIDLAIQSYDQALRLSTADDPNRRVALINQGQIALDNGNFEEARAAFELALQLAANDAQTLYDYARTLAALGDEGTAAALRSAFDLDSSLAERAQRDDWQRYFANAGTRVANLIASVAAARQAAAQQAQGQYVEAIAAYQTAVAADPGVGAYWQALGDLFVQQGRHAEAVAAYQSALPLLARPADTLKALAALGLAQIETKDYAGAIATLTQAINAQSSAAPVSLYVSLARAYELSGDNALAEATYIEAARRDLATLDYTYRAGVNLLLANQVEQALAVLQPVINQGGLRVEAVSEANLRETPAATGAVLKVLTIGTGLRINGTPLVGEGGVWWPVVDQDGATGWVSAARVVPAPPPVVPSVPPIGQQPVAPVTTP
jgi:tetratricopeptide (TPR) repeat protein